MVGTGVEGAAFIPLPHPIVRISKSASRTLYEPPCLSVRLGSLSRGRRQLGVLEAQEARGAHHPEPSPQPRSSTVRAHLGSELGPLDPSCPLQAPPVRSTLEPLSRLGQAPSWPSRVLGPLGMSCSLASYALSMWPPQGLWALPSLRTDPLLSTWQNCYDKSIYEHAVLKMP